jgi:hypothetical protein
MADGPGGQIEAFHFNSPMSSSSLRAKRSNPFFLFAEGWIASSLRSSQ